MAVTFGGYRYGSSGVNNTSVTINPNSGGSGSGGSGCSAGDWMVMVFTGPTSMANVNVPGNMSGWTVVRSFDLATGATSFETGIWMKQRGIGETDYAWPLNGGTVTSSCWTLFWYKNAAVAYAGAFWDRNGHATSLTNIAPSVTTDTAHSVVVSLSTERTVAVETDSQIAVDNGMTKQLFLIQPTGSGDQTVSVADKTLVSAGSSGDTTWTYPNIQANNGIAGHVWLIPTVELGDPDFTAKIGDTGGVFADTYVRVGDTGGVLSQISGMRAMLPRYRSVTQMLAEPEFYWAHRGGSRDYPEMTSFAYGQSALLSYGCLELSLARTSDGVWFGLHDADINRTSGTTGLGAASTMTWATVQGYQVLGSMAVNNPAQPNRPYVRLQDILEAYPKHLFVVDIKYANTYREELLNILDSYGGPERFIGKAYGVGSVSFATSCASRGYQSWGYFYGTDIPSLTSAYVNQWTIIGMDYTAAQTDWNTLAAYRTNGQRMSGHICPNAAAVAAARSKGATGFMVSGVGVVTPFAP